MRTQRLFLLGLALGAVMGVAALIAGPLTVLPGVIVWSWLIVRRPRFVGASGGLVGFGVAWLLLLGQAVWRCANDQTCAQVDPTPWLSFGGVFVVIGLVLGILTWRRLHDSARSR